MKIEDFTFFTGAGRSYIPKATVSSTTISINSGAVDKFGIRDMKFVMLGYNEETKTIAIKPLREPKDGAIKLRHHGPGAAISAKAFIDYFSIPTNKSNNRFSCYFNEGLITFSLEE